MSALHKYFHNFHHLPPPTQHSHITPHNQSLEALSLLFCVKKSNFHIFTHTPSFMDTLPDTLKSPLFGESQLFNAILEMQAHILKENPSIFDELLPYFARLNLAHIIDDNEFALFTQAQAHSIAQTQETRSRPSLTHLKSILANLHTKLSPLLEENMQSMLASSWEKLESGHLCIGVTGVLSAGKSTFLNALLGEEILGTSTIPETANLTLLRYGESGARVHFWSKEQWRDLCEESAYDEGIRAFVQECEAHFGKDLDQLITQPSQIKDIHINELSAYTSANHSSKLCNLISQVELFTPLGFLQNGVEIVDTPGLDDPITKREDITREFLERCDMLIHVMNASCAATQKDIDFILESLLEQNISRLLVVLTRIDLLSKAEQASALEYTKASLIAQLKKAHYKGDMTQLINRIDFLPLAGYAALLHRTKQSEKANISLEESGILQIESYLQDMLLGEQSLRARDMLYLAYKSTYKIAQEAKAALSLQTALLYASNEELEKIITQEEAHNKSLLDELQKLKSHLSSLHNELKSFLSDLTSLSTNALSKATEVLKDKIFDDIVYDYKQGNKTEVANLHKMIDLSLRDCFGDIAREYRYKLGSKITQLKASLAHNDEVSAPNIHFQLKNAELHAIMESLTLHTLIKHANKENTLRQSLQDIFNTLFEHFVRLIETKNEDISTTFLAYFHNIAQYETSRIQNEITQKEQSIQAILKKREDTNRQSQMQHFNTKERALDDIINELQTHLASLE